MIFNEIVKACELNKNGTYDIYPVIDVDKKRVKFKRGNSTVLNPYRESQGLSGVIDHGWFTDVHPDRIVELIRIKTTRLYNGESKDEGTIWRTQLC